MRVAILGLVVLSAPAAAFAGDWKTIFDGKTLDGWKLTKENPGSFKIDDGQIVAHGPRAHLFYVGDDKPFVDFEFECEVMTKPKSNAGIYFHTKYQEAGWPKGGYEAQVNATHGDPKKTGSLYAVENVNPAPHEDNEWFKYNIRVKGRRIVLTINDKVAVDYTEPEGKKPGKDFERKLSQGTFAFQAHDPISEVRFRNIRVRRLD